MTGFYQRIEGQVGSAKLPPLERWSPDLSGDIDIRIDSEGRWFHQGARIERASLVSLFARILRRESDLDYYLVTPQEKWRIQVQGYPLRVVALEHLLVAGQVTIRATVNNDLAYTLSNAYPIALCPNDEGAFLQLDYGLCAKLDRPTWYQLCQWVETDAEGLYLDSAGTRFRLS